MVHFSLQRKRKKKSHLHGIKPISKSLDEIQTILNTLRGTVQSSKLIADSDGGNDEELLRNGTVTTSKWEKNGNTKQLNSDERVGIVIQDESHSQWRGKGDEHVGAASLGDGVVRPSNGEIKEPSKTVQSGQFSQAVNGNHFQAKMVRTTHGNPMQEHGNFAGNKISFADVLQRKTSAQRQQGSDSTDTQNVVPIHGAVMHGKDAGKAKTFAEALQGGPSAYRQHVGSILKVSPDILQKRLDLNKFSIIGRIILSKGDAPWNLVKLKEKLSNLWNLHRPWRLISLGKGFYQIMLTSAEDKLTVWSRGALNLKPGILRLQEYSIMFDPLKEKTTHTQTWVRIFHLPWGLWDPSIISDIVWRFGTPLKFDKATMDGNFGHYARVLVDVDLAKPIKPIVLLECGDDLVEVKIVPEKLPSFCKACSTIGHVSTECWTLKSNKEQPRNSAQNQFRGKKVVEQDVALENIKADSEKAKASEPTQSPKEIAKVVANNPNTDLDQEGINRNTAIRRDANMAPAGDSSLDLVTKKTLLAAPDSRRFEEGMDGNSSDIEHDLYNLNEEPVKKKWGFFEEDSDTPTEEPWIEVERKRSKKVNSTKRRPCTRSQSLRN